MSSSKVDPRELSLVALADGRSRARLGTLLGSRRGRAKFLEMLYHHPPFAARYVTVLDGAQRRRDAIHQQLKARGAPEECYVISTHQDLDGKTMLLSDALDALYPEGDGTILLCVPGQLAYYEGESNPVGDYQWIVARRT